MYTIYKVINLLSNEYYIGVHKTKKENDAYYGSGLRIRRAINKYGKKNFKKEILYRFETKEEAYNKEREIIQVALQDPLCYNLKEGGIGGW